MKRWGSIAAIVAGLALVPFALAAQEAVAKAPADMTGSWLISLDTPEGSFEMTWEIEQHEDGTLTGTTANDMIGEAPIDGGWVEDGQFGFSVYVEAQGQSMDVVYEGSIVDDELTGFLDAGGGMFQADFVGVRVEGR
ncbi:MAG: hypothetical protein MJB57_04530 [Gemmatimonadetes bacterium]|nr:hypothetical protein [Gemmatimonadota bacterium]